MGIHPSGGVHDPCVWQSVRGLNLGVQVTRSHIMRVLHLILDLSHIPYDLNTGNYPLDGVHDPSVNITDGADMYTLPVHLTAICTWI